MKLVEIDKTRYRKHLRIVFAGIVVILIIITLVSSTLFIQLFSTPEVSHFWHNLSGVIFAAAAVAFTLHKIRHHPFMVEVAYVWDLKQQLNRIYRKQHKIEPLIEKKAHAAMIIMNYMYRGSKQLYQLDDNTLTMENLDSKISVLEKKMLAADLDLSTNSYDPTMLDRF